MRVFKTIISGTLDVSGSSVFRNGITGSLSGTANNAIFSETSSYLNDLSQNLVISGNLFIHGTASIDNLHTIYETASIIYSSGSNQL